MYGPRYNTRSQARWRQPQQQWPFGGRHHPPPGSRGRGRQDASAYLLYSMLSAIYQRVSQLERPVPITVALLAVNIVAYYLPEILLPFGINLVEIGAICLQPARIVKLVMVPPPSLYGGGGWDEWLASLMSLGTAPSRGLSASTAARWQEVASRVWLSAFVHSDELHLYWNMMSLLYKGVNLEMSMGSLPFVGLVLFSWVVSHALILLSALALHACGYNGSYNTCAVGFSAVLFAMKYVLNATSDGWVSVQGIPLPVGWACWAELVLTSLISPNASFLGHLCGIFAGVLWLDAGGVFRLLKRLHASLTSLLSGRDPHRRYTYMRAPSGRRPQPQQQQEQQPPGPAPSAPPATAPDLDGNGGNNGMSDATEERLLQEAIRRSLAEQQGQGQGGGGASSGMYSPSAPYVPTATVVGRDGAGGPRLPTYEEAVQRGVKRR